LATPPTRPALRRRYDRRRQQLTLDAARVFAECGFDQTSVQELTEAMGLASGGLYHYFGSKQLLLIHICDQLMDPLLDETRALIASADAPEDQLRALVRAWVAHVIDHRDHMLVFQQERHLIERGHEWRGVRASRKQFERLLADLLARVQDTNGGLPGDRRLALSALLGMVNHTPQWYRRNGRLTPQEVADGYVDLLLGLAASSPS
jgi:TetR/AcrR family transcriptional regulator, cholesterol catabolism regulator